MYTIGQVSEMFHLPISTLRYYDKEGLFPSLERKGNIRCFSDTEIEAIRVIECLKASGLEIKDIKQFFQWVTKGASSYPNRKQLFKSRKAAVLEEMKQLEKTLAMLEFKCWYYGKAIEDGNEKAPSVYFVRHQCRHRLRRFPISWHHLSSGLKSPTEMSFRRMAELHIRRQLRCCAARPRILFEIRDFKLWKNGH